MLKDHIIYLRWQTQNDHARQSNKIIGLQKRKKYSGSNIKKKCDLLKKEN